MVLKWKNQNPNKSFCCVIMPRKIPNKNLHSLDKGIVDHFSGGDNDPLFAQVKLCSFLL